MERYGSQSRVDVNSVARNKVFRAVNKIRGAAFFLGNLAKSRTNDMSLMEREVLKVLSSLPFSEMFSQIDCFYEMKFGSNLTLQVCKQV